MSSDRFDFARQAVSLGVMLVLLLALAAGPEGSVPSGDARSRAATQPATDAVAASPQARAYAVADLLFIATIEAIGPTLQQRTDPPTFVTGVQFADVEPLRGEPLEARFSYRATGGAAAALPAVGTRVMVAGRSREAERDILSMVPATPEARAEAGRYASLPLGWQLSSKGVVSPWAAAAGVAPAAKARPPLLAGPGVRFTADPVIPAAADPYRNPQGDGVFRLTVTNTTREPLDVPALLSVGNEVRWASSVLLLDGEHVRLLPGAEAAPVGAGPTRIAPGKSVSGTVNVLDVPDMSWPGGATRVALRFTLGELAADGFFYYHQDHHGRLRAISRKR